jgi:hypothetical protein
MVLWFCGAFGRLLSTTDRRYHHHRHALASVGNASRAAALVFPGMLRAGRPLRACTPRARHHRGATGTA